MVEHFQKSNAMGKNGHQWPSQFPSHCLCVFLCMYDSVMNTNVTQALFQSHCNPLPSPDNNQAGRTVNSGRGLNNRHQSGLSAMRRKPLHTSMPPSVLHFLPSQNSSPRLPHSASFFFYSLFDSPATLSRHSSLFVSSHAAFFHFSILSFPPLLSIKSYATTSRTRYIWPSEDSPPHTLTSIHMHACSNKVNTIHIVQTMHGQTVCNTLLKSYMRGELSNVHTKRKSMHAHVHRHMKGTNN